MKFKKGHDPRRHVLTADERQRGGTNSRAAGKGRDFTPGHDERRRRFSRQECAKAGEKGFASLMEKGKNTRGVRKRIYAHYGKNVNGTFLNRGAGI